MADIAAAMAPDDSTACPSPLAADSSFGMVSVRAVLTLSVLKGVVPALPAASRVSILVSPLRWYLSPTNRPSLARPENFTGPSSVVLPLTRRLSVDDPPVTARPLLIAAPPERTAAPVTLRLPPMVWFPLICEFPLTIWFPLTVSELLIVVGPLTVSELLSVVGPLTVNELLMLTGPLKYDDPAT